MSKEGILMIGMIIIVLVLWFAFKVPIWVILVIITGTLLFFLVNMFRKGKKK